VLLLFDSDIVRYVHITRIDTNDYNCWCILQRITLITLHSKCIKYARYCLTTNVCCFDTRPIDLVFYKHIGKMYTYNYTLWTVNWQSDSCPMQDEHEHHFGFLCKMSIKVAKKPWWVATWRYDNNHEYHSSTNFNTNERFCQWGKCVNTSPH